MRVYDVLCIIILWTLCVLLLYSYGIYIYMGCILIIAST